MNKAALLAAILLMALVPHVEAAGAAPRPWAPYNATSEVVSLAFADDGVTIAAALRAPSTAGPTTPGGIGLPGLPGAPCSAEASTVCTDLAILDFEAGFARNGSVTTAVRPIGKTHVAVSRDGSAIAALGRDGAASAESLHLQYHRLTSGNWTAGTVYSADITLPTSAVAVGLTLSADGRRVAALTSDGDVSTLRGFAYGNTLVSAFEIRQPGTPRALATASDMSRVLVAGQWPVGNFTYGGAYILPFAQGEPLSSFFDSSANNTDVSAGVMSDDGLTSALGSSDGKIRVFHGGSLASPVVATVGTTAVANLTISEDGARLAASTGQALTSFDVTGSAFVTLWNTTLPGQNVTGLSMDRTGSLVVASSSGTGGGVFAFDATLPTPLWSIPGDTRDVVVNSAGTRIAYAQRTAIGAAALPRLLTMDLVGGGKVAPQRTIALPGNVTYEVQLRNDGAATEQVTFEEGAPEMFLTTPTPVTLVRPGATVRVNLTVIIDQPLAGPRVFNITARALSGAVDNVTLSIAPQPTLDVKLQVNGSDILATPGVASSILVTIVNNGTSDANVALAAAQTVSAGSPWALTLSEQSLTVLRGTRSSVTVVMTPPADILNGTSSTVRFTLQGQDVFDTAQVVFRVNPDLKVEVNATGVTKFIEPGKRGQYNVTITNTGSLPRAFEVFSAITESSGRSWNVDMQAQTVRLEPLSKRVFPVTIIAPGDAQPNDRVSVQVTARSIPEQVNETVVQDNVTLFGVAVELKIPTPSTTPNGIPNPPVAGVVAITLFAALLLRRRP